MAIFGASAPGLPSRAAIIPFITISSRAIELLVKYGASPPEPSKNKLQKPVLLSDREKVTVSRPRLPRNPPQIHHDLPSRNTKKTQISPIKTPFHHDLFFWRNFPKSNLVKMEIQMQKAAPPGDRFASPKVVLATPMSQRKLKPLWSRRTVQEMYRTVWISRLPRRNPVALNSYP